MTWIISESLKNCRFFGIKVIFFVCMVFPQTYFETVGIDWLEPNAYGGAEPNSKTIEMPPGGERRQIQTIGWLVTYFAVIHD